MDDKRPTIDDDEHQYFDGKRYRGGWYKLAEINGLQGDETLTEGTSLIIPAGVMRSSNNAETFTPYDPAEMVGNVSPTALKPPVGKNNKCGGLATVFLAVIAIAVFVATRIPLTAFFGGSAIAGGVAAGAVSSIASQGVGVATGIQEKFSWNAVALSAIGGGVGGALNAGGAPATWQQAATRAVVSSAITQGIGVATGLQKEFSWAGVAAAGVGAAVGHAVVNSLPAGEFGRNVVANTASGIANAATRSLIEGTDFGDNLMAALPDVIAQTIGGELEASFARRGEPIQFKWRREEYIKSRPAPALTEIVDRPMPQINQPASESVGADLWAPFFEAIDNPAPPRSIDAILADFPTHQRALGGAVVTARTPLGDAQSEIRFRLDEASATFDAAAAELSLANNTENILDFAVHEGRGLLLTLGGFGQATSWPFAVGFDLLRSNVHGRGMAPDQSDRHATDVSMAVAGVALGTWEIAAAKPFIVAGATTRAPVIAVANDLEPALLARAAACFAAGTLIHTAEGLKPIEAIQVGDFVLAQPELGGERAYRRVNETFRREPQDLVQVIVASGSRHETIVATLEHPFWVKGSGWTGAKDLGEGQLVELADGSDARIANIKRLSEQQPVFNYAVDGFHTYYVGSLGVWVHNASKLGWVDGRPTWRQSEIDVGVDLGPGYLEQQRFFRGLPSTRRDAVRLDWVRADLTASFEVKNVNITTNLNGLIAETTSQARYRVGHLPPGMQQNVIIDIRGQVVSSAQQNAIVETLVNQSNGALAPTSIRFKTR